ncbi:uncharacterized protein LOC124925022 [Impatiens glandulifera]|uniref:uncharacterized protein LOC124925022 n=1 Tax=Impatiens glandulifera TaxID=253017 RepID=UPI001FB10C2B|nr:uncharacterized protein LOC124925022 [Impatiens glandulifera]
MVIPGPESPGDTIDIFLQPLIDELSELWNIGVVTFDASISQHFTLRAALLWTINDFPAYANLSGWSTKGKLACPCCNKDTLSMRLQNGGKECYMCHRRFLPLDHKWRANKNLFDGKAEKRLPPKSFSGKDILSQVQDLEDIILSRDITKKTRLYHEKRGDNWNKKSKTKDNLKTRLDLQLLNIRPELHPIDIGGVLQIPVAPYMLSSDEKKQLCLFLKQLKMPEGFCSNLAPCINVDDKKFSGLKSHDCHILLEYLIPLATRGLTLEPIYEALVELSMFFSKLCSKSLKMEDLKQLETQIPITLSTEAILGGPVQYRWMYPIEQYMGTLKSYVRNQSHPEASIVESYLTNECISLCSRYFDTSDCGLTENKTSLSIFLSIEDLSGGVGINLDRVDRKLARIYVLKNCEEVEPFYNEYLQKRISSGMVLSEEEWDTQYINWFKTKVEELYREEKSQRMEDLLSLARGPLEYAKTLVCCKVNGYKFNTEEHDEGLTTQNSDIYVVGNNGIKTIDYYGVLTHIIELQYLGGNRIVLFKCRWFDVETERGIKEDKYGFVSINCQRMLKSNEPFVLATQAKQVFYVKDNTSKGWHIVTKTNPRYSYL